MKRKSIILAFTALILVFSACRNDYANIETNETYIVFDSSIEAFRTIFPEEALSATPNTLKDYALYVQQEDKGFTLLKSWTDYTSFIHDKLPIKKGKWDFKLTAKSQNGISYKAEILEKGIVAGENLLDFNLELASYSFEDSGAISLTMFYPYGEDFFPFVTLYKYDADKGFLEGVEQAQNLIISGTKEIEGEEKHYFNFTETGIESGFYKLLFSLYADQEKTLLLNEYTESVCVSDGCISKAEREISSLDEVYSITYNWDGGIISQAQVYPLSFTRKSADITLPAATDITKTGYDFGGWFTDEKFDSSITNIVNGSTENVVLYAKWIPHTYKLTFNSGFETEQNMEDLNCVYGQSYKIPACTFTKEGYLFTGWNTAQDGTGQEYAVDTDIINLKEENGATIPLYAQWQAITYTIKFDGNNATSGTMNNINCSYNETYTLTANAFTRTGYTFDRWNTKADGSGNDYTNKSNVCNLTTSANGIVTLYAIWKENTYTIAFNGNGSTSGSMSNLTNCSYTKTYTLTANTFTKTGYTFNGWNTKADGTGTAISNGAGVNKLTATNGGTATLYAQWKANTYTIAFNGNGSTNGSMTSLTNRAYGTSYTLTANAFTRTGYTFDGWNTKADGTGTSYAGGASVSNLTSTAGGIVTLYAQWRKGIYCSQIEEYLSSLTPSETPYDIIILDKKPELTIIRDAMRNHSDIFINLDLEKCTELTEIDCEGSYFHTGGSSNGYGDVSIWCQGYLGAFCSCLNLYSIKLPNSITKIGTAAFYGCRLSSISLPSSLTSIGEWAFGSSNIENITIPSSVTTIENFAFSRSKIQSIYISDSATNIGHYVFYDCRYLSSVRLPESISTINSFLFYNCTELKSITIPPSVTSIGHSAFGCSGIESITIPNSVTSMNIVAFYNCNSLITTIYNGTLEQWCNIKFESAPQLSTYRNINKLIIDGNELKDSITIPDSVTSIGDYTFSGCSSLTSVNIPDSVTSIGSYTFAGCSSLTSVTIPDSVTSIEYSAFYGCSSLTFTNYTGTLEQWCNINFSSSTSNPSLYSHKLIINRVELKGPIILPSSITSIGSYTFTGCSSLTSVTIPDSVTSIGDYTFSGCSSLTSVTIPDSVTSIEYSAFNGCSSLTSVTIPDSVTSIHSYAFFNCSSLTSINYNAINCSYYGSDVFYNAGSASTGITFTIGKDVTNLPDGLLNFSGFNLKTIAYESGRTSISKISDSVLSDKTKVTSVVIPSTVTSIGNDAFNGYSGLTSVNFKGTISQWCSISFGNTYSNPLYYTHSLLINGNRPTGAVSLSSGVTKIPDYTFYNCSGMTSIELPSTLTSIKSSAFTNCTGLTSVNFKGTISQWCSISFGNDYSNPLNYSHSLLINGSKPTGSITISSGATEIPAYTFYDCTGVTSVSLPSTLTKIGAYAFYNTAITNPNLGNTKITTIESYAFANITGLPIQGSQSGGGPQTINMPSSLTSIGISAITTKSTNNIMYVSLPSGNWYRTTSKTDWLDKTNGTSTTNKYVTSETSYYYYKK